MLKILVVDDEPKVRRGVSGLIQAYPDKYKLLGSCEDAGEVIQFLEDEIPDVIITDICMPKQDGLELIYYLKHRYHNLDFIILSGYGEFEYAKKALQYQVYDFLLKPLRPEKLYEALEGVSEKRKNNNVEKAESMNDNNFFNLIRSEDKEAQEKNLKALELYEQKGRYCVGIFDFGEIPETNRKNLRVWELLEEEEIPEPVQRFSCFAYQYILLWKEEPDKAVLEKGLLSIENKVNGKVYLGISSVMEGGRECRAMYFQALNAVKQHIYGDDKLLYLFQELPDHTKMIFPDDMCDQLLQSIRLGSVERTEILAQNLLNYYKEQKCPILFLKRHLLLLQRRIEMLSEELGLESEMVREVLNFVKNIEEVNFFSEVEKVWKESLYQITQEMSAIAEQKMNSFYLEQIVSYIRKNYSENLSLEDVAEHVNLSVGYLGNYFKQKMGINFTDYLWNLRIEKAKELLLHSNEKIYRIAERVGYQNSQYFVTAFKKKVGLTPMEYRKCLMKSETIKILDKK